MFSVPKHQIRNLEHQAPLTIQIFGLKGEKIVRGNTVMIDKNSTNMKKKGKKNRKAELINAAAKLFRASGYDGTSVRDIAKEVGITSGSIFYYFESKEDLLEAIILHGISTGVKIVENELKNEVTPVNRFYALVYAHLLALHSDPDSAHEVSVREWRRLPEDARKRLRSLNERYKSIWRQELLSLKDAGYLKSDHEICRKTLIAALNWSLAWLKPKTKKSYEDVANNLCSVVLNLTKQEFISLKQDDTRI
tara:strand:+ start:15507 stop:16256 length:750 start_codon:yes stop_codon:yes gene_type:complete